MKILFVAGSVNQIGGIERYNRVYISALKEAGADVSLVERAPGGFFAKAIFAAQVLLSSFFKKPDFIICTHINFSPLCLYAKRYFHIPYSVSVYGIEAADIRKAVFKKALAEASAITYLFAATAEDVARQIPGADKKLFNLPNSVDGERFGIKEKSEELLSRYGLKGSKVVLTIGRMSTLDGDNKGYRRVIKAMPGVLKAVPGVKYLLAGSGDDIAGVRGLVKELGLEGSVILADAPADDKMVDYYNLADVFVLPSKNEGFPPIVILEALASGVPVIGGDQRGAEKAMLNGELGSIVGAENIEAISGAIIKVLREGISRENRESLRAKTLEIYGLSAFKLQIKKFLELIKK